MAHRYWKEACVENMIDLRIGPAIETLQQLLIQGYENSYDFAFIDADKPSYDSYYELCLRLVRRGGLIVLDNMLYHGLVPDPLEKSENAAILRQLNSKVGSDIRVTSVLLPIADGITLAIKK